MADIVIAQPGRNSPQVRCLDGEIDPGRLRWSVISAKVVPMSASEPWLTKRELARELRCSIRTVERLRLPAMRVGGQNRYRISEVETHLRGRGRAGEVVPLRPETQREPAA